jgi:hypothetical protein
VDVILHNLITGRDQFLGSVGDIAFNRPGDLLAYTVDATVKDGNGLFVFDTRNGRINTLDNDAKVYSRLAWSDDGTALAVMKGAEVEKMRERLNVLLTFPAVQAAVGDTPASPVVFDPAKASGVPQDWVVSDRTALSWSDDNKRVFFGMKEQVPAPDSTARKSTDELANVDVWNSADERIQSQQMIRAEADRNRHRVPIVPLVIVGSAEIFPIVGKLDWRWWKRVSRWPTLPVTPTLSLLPLPSKWHVQVLEPLHPGRHHGPEAADDPAVVERINREVEHRMAAALAAMLARRRSVFRGSIFDRDQEPEAGPPSPSPPPG